MHRSASNPRSGRRATESALGASRLRVAFASQMPLRRIRACCIALLNEARTTLRSNRFPEHGRPVIVFDLDDTLFNLRDALRSILTDELGHEAWRNVQTRLNGRAKRQSVSAATLLEIAFRRRLLELGDLEPQASYVVAELRAMGYAIEVWTARGAYPDAFQITLETLRPLGIGRESVRVLRSRASKARLLSQRSDVCFLIDDSLTHARQACQAGYANRVILMSRPWNRSLRPTGIKVAQALRDVLALIRDADPSSRESA